MIKYFSETIENEAKEQKGGFLGMLLGTLGTSLFGILLTDKDKIRADEGTVRASQDFLLTQHPLTNFGIQKYYQNEP